MGFFAVGCGKLVRLWRKTQNKCVLCGKIRQIFSTACGKYVPLVEKTPKRAFFIHKKLWRVLLPVEKGTLQLWIIFVWL